MQRRELRNENETKTKNRNSACTKEAKRQDGKEASVADAINGKEHPHAIPRKITRKKDINVQYAQLLCR